MRFNNASEALRNICRDALSHFASNQIKAQDPFLFVPKCDFLTSVTYCFDKYFHRKEASVCNHVTSKVKVLPEN